MINDKAVRPYADAGHNLLVMFFLNLTLTICAALSYFYWVRVFAAIVALVVGVFYVIRIRKFAISLKVTKVTFITYMAIANFIANFLKNLYALEAESSGKMLTEVIYLVSDSILVILVCYLLIYNLAEICKARRYSPHKAPIMKANGLVFVSSLAGIANIVSNIFIRMFYDKLAEMTLEIYHLNPSAITHLSFFKLLDPEKITQATTTFIEEIPAVQFTLAALTAGNSFLFLSMLLLSGLYFKNLTNETTH